MQKMYNHFLISQKFLENKWKKFGNYGKARDSTNFDKENQGTSLWKRLLIM